MSKFCKSINLTTHYFIDWISWALRLPNYSLVIRGHCGLEYIGWLRARVGIWADWITFGRWRYRQRSCVGSRTCSQWGEVGGRADHSWHPRPWGWDPYSRGCDTCQRGSGRGSGQRPFLGLVGSGRLHALVTSSVHGHWDEVKGWPGWLTGELADSWAETCVTN